MMIKNTRACLFLCMVQTRSINSYLLHHVCLNAYLSVVSCVSEYYYSTIKIINLKLHATMCIINLKLQNSHATMDAINLKLQIPFL